MLNILLNRIVLNKKVYIPLFIIWIIFDIAKNTYNYNTLKYIENILFIILMGISIANAIKILLKN